MFDDYSIGVNPDVRAYIISWDIRLHTILLQDNYRIYDFVGRDPKRSPHGRIFYQDPNELQRYLPSADLLRDHFHQCVLRHVKGAGEGEEPQRRFDPDIDLRAGGFNLAAGSWWSSSEGKRQLIAEIAGRLGGAVTTRNQI
jgi:hypothetical protein